MHARTDALLDPARDARLVRRGEGQRTTQVRLRDTLVGGERFVVFAGPCAVESRAQLREAATAALGAGCSGLRGGAFKPRTNPRSFQGLGEAGLELLAAERLRTGLPVVSELLDPADLPLFAEVDLLQIGARNMHNYALLRALGRAGKPVLLKRGFAATVEEWLLAAEYIVAAGNPDVILCERGIRGFDPATRNVLDLASVALAKRATHLPILVDPSHATGRRELVAPLALAAAAAGADGLLLDVHARPHEALCDGAQALTPEDLAGLMASLPPLLAALGRSLHPAPAAARAPRADTEVVA